MWHQMWVAKWFEHCQWNVLTALREIFHSLCVVKWNETVGGKFQFEYCYFEVGRIRFVLFLKHFETFHSHKYSLYVTPCIIWFNTKSISFVRHQDFIGETSKFTLLNYQKAFSRKGLPEATGCWTLFGSLHAFVCQRTVYPGREREHAFICFSPNIPFVLITWFKSFFICSTTASVTRATREDSISICTGNK